MMKITYWVRSSSTVFSKIFSETDIGKRIGGKEMAFHYTFVRDEFKLFENCSVHWRHWLLIQAIASMCECVHTQQFASHKYDKKCRIKRALRPKNELSLHFIGLEISAFITRAQNH